MKIRIEHTGNPMNYGTNMMVTNFMYYIDKYSSTKKIYELDVYNDKDLENYKYQYKAGIMTRKTIDYNLCYSKSFIEKVINKIKRDFFSSYYMKKNLKALCSDTDTLVILGGDDLSEYYGLKSLEKELFRISYIKDKMNLYLVGQTIGPFKEDRLDKAKIAMEGVEIYSRDPWTTQYLEQSLKLRHIVDSRDLALLPLPSQDNKNIEEDILNKYFLNRDEYFTVVPSGLYESYCSDINTYIDNWLEIIKYLKKVNPNKKIVLLPHVLRSKEVDDRNIIRKLKEKLFDINDLVYIDDELSPLQARFILGNGILTITGRMHAAISTLQMNKPAISISYSVKYNGVIGEGLGLRALIVSGEDDSMWINKNVQQDVIKKIDHVLENYETIKNEISINIKKCELKTIDMIKIIASKLG